jgi:hypothetical protein
MYHTESAIMFVHFKIILPYSFCHVSYLFREFCFNACNISNDILHESVVLLVDEYVEVLTEM